MTQVYVSVRGVWSSRPSLDWVVVGAALTAHAVLRARYNWHITDFTLDDLVKDDRMRIYTSLATVSSLLFGFATASIAFFYGSADGERVDLLKRVMNHQIVRTWRGSLSAPLIAVAASVGAMVADTGKTGLIAVAWIIEGAVIFLALRAVRLRWMFVSTLQLLSMDIANPSSVKELPGGRSTPTKKPRPKHSTEVPIA